MVDVTEPAAAPQVYGLPRDTLAVRGAERKTWLDGLLTCAVAGVGVDKAGYGLLLSKQGKIVTDVFLVDDGERLWLGVALGRGPAVRELLDRHLVMEDAELEEAPQPLAWSVARSASAGEGVQPLAQGSLKLGALDLRVWLSHQGGSALPDAAGLLAEHGVGVFGVDFDERDNPHEASLDRLAVSWTKGCYLGQEVVCMQDMRGKVKRRVVALDAGPALLSPSVLQQDVLTPDGAVAGQVSSVYPAPSGARILARLSASALESSDELRILGEAVRVAVGSVSNLS